jgi:hypothetical protein
LSRQRHVEQGVLDDSSGLVRRHPLGPLLAMTALPVCHGAVPIFIGSKLTIPVGNISVTSDLGPDLRFGLFVG